MNKFPNVLKPFLDRGRKWQSKYSQWSASNPRKAEVVEAAKHFLYIYAGVLVFASNVYGFTVCVGPSMLPTIDQDGELALVELWPYRLPKACRKEYERNDIIISRSKDDPGKTVCKRISGTAGDVISYLDKHGLPRTIMVPDDHVWLLGDNPENSNDSRYYGPMPVANLQGRVTHLIGRKPELHFHSVKTVDKMNGRKPPSK